MLSIIKTFLMTISILVIAMSLCSCAPGLKNVRVLCIDNENLTTRKVTLRGPRNNNSIVANHKFEELLLCIGKTNGHIYTITCDDSQKNCYVNVYNREGEFIKQHRIPYIDRWYFNTLIGFAGERECMVYKKSEAREVSYSQPYSIQFNSSVNIIDLNTGEEKTIVADNDNYASNYSIHKYDVDTVVIVDSTCPRTLNSAKICDDRAWRHYAKSCVENVMVYDVKNDKVLGRFKCNDNESMIIDKYSVFSPKGLFWLETQLYNSNWDFIKSYFYEFELEGMTLTQKINGMPTYFSGKDLIVKSILSKDKDEYLFIAGAQYKPSYLGKYSVASNNAVMKELTFGHEPKHILVSGEYASSSRLGLRLVTNDMPPNFFLHKEEYRVYDNDLKLLRKFPISRFFLPLGYMTEGSVFYYAYYIW